MTDHAARAVASDAQFIRRVAIVFALAALAALFLYLANLVLLIIAAIIVAVILRGFARQIVRVLPLRESHAVFVAILLILGILALGGWLFGRQIADQVVLLVERLPSDWAHLQTLARELPFGEAIAKQAGNAASALAGYVDEVPSIALSFAGAIANIGLALVGGVMLAIEPKSYRDGVLLLFPAGPRASVKRALDATGRALGGWLVAQLISMVIIGLLTGLGLWAIGLPFALGLGLFAGLAQFVPVIGPIVSAVPGLIVAATTGGDVLLWTALVYLGVQQAEGNLVTPWVQKHFAGIPMAVALFAIVAFGALFGILGVILATPLALICITLVRSLYIRDVLEEPVTLPGESAARAKRETMAAMADGAVDSASRGHCGTNEHANS